MRTQPEPAPEQGGEEILPPSHGCPTWTERRGCRCAWLPQAAPEPDKCGGCGGTWNLVAMGYPGPCQYWLHSDCGWRSDTEQAERLIAENERLVDRLADAALDPGATTGEEGRA